MSRAWLIFDLATKNILGLHSSSNEETSDLYPENPSTQGKIELSLDHPIFGEQLKWRVVDGPAVQLKTEVVVSSNKGQILADGVDEATISFVGLTAPVQVELGDNIMTVVNNNDPELVITSDVPKTFEISIVDDLHYAEPITVEAI